MTADKRNSSVVLALILSMTIGVVVLLGLESQLVPARHDFSGSTLLMAREGLYVQQVEISYLPAPLDDRALAAARQRFDPRDTICWILTDGSAAHLETAGPHVQLVVLGTDQPTLDDPQKQTLLTALGSMSQLRGVDLVPVRLAADSDPQRNPALSPQALEQLVDLRDFLKRKGIIAD